MQHPNTILAIKNLAATLRSLRKYKEVEKLVVQAEEAKSRVIGATMANVQEAQETVTLIFPTKGVY